MHLMLSHPTLPGLALAPCGWWRHMGDVRMGRGCELCWLLGSWTMRIRTQLGSGQQTISSQGEWAEKSLLPLGKHVLGSGEDTHRGVSVLLR